MNYTAVRRLLSHLPELLFPKLRGRRNVRECVTTLPVLRAQIREAARHLEAAVSGICGNFQNIADRSHEAVAKAAEMLGSGQTGGSVEESIETSRATISLLLQRLEHAGQISALAIARMEEIEQTVQGMESLLEEVQKISFASKIVALNAKIEAVHVGALGAGFEVVAEEISRQAERTTGLTEGIANRIQETRNCVHSAAGKLKEFMADDVTQSADSRNAAQAALHVLFTSHQNACDSVAMMTSENVRLREEISQAIVNLQFQDRFGRAACPCCRRHGKDGEPAGTAGALVRRLPDGLPQLVTGGGPRLLQHARRAPGAYPIREWGRGSNSPRGRDGSGAVLMETRQEKLGVSEVRFR